MRMKMTTMTMMKWERKTSNEQIDEDEENTDSDTESEEVDPRDKPRKEVVNDLNSAWEEQVELETLRQGLLKILKLELLTFCNTCIYIT